MLDVLYRRLKAKEGGVGRAEFRLPIMAPASIILPLGLLLFGWCAEKKWHWIVADESSSPHSPNLALRY